MITREGRLINNFKSESKILKVEQPKSGTQSQTISISVNSTMLKTRISSYSNKSALACKIPYTKIKVLPLCTLTTLVTLKVKFWKKPLKRNSNSKSKTKSKNKKIFIITLQREITNKRWNLFWISIKRNTITTRWQIWMTGKLENHLAART